MNDCCLLLSRTLPVSLCLSLKRTLVGGRRFRPNFWTSGFHVFWVQQPSELSVEERNLLSSANKFPSCWCCGISVHVPTSFCCCGPQLVYTTMELSTDQESLQIPCGQADSRLATVSHIFVTAFTVVACCVLLSTCSFLSHPCFHGSGRVF